MYTGTQFDRNIDWVPACFQLLYQSHSYTSKQGSAFKGFFPSLCGKGDEARKKTSSGKKERKPKRPLSPLQCAARHPPSLHHLFFLPLPQPPWCVFHATRCERLWDGGTGAAEGDPGGEIRGLTVCVSILRSHPHEWVPGELWSEPRSESWTSEPPPRNRRAQRHAALLELKEN